MPHWPRVNEMTLYRSRERSLAATAATAAAPRSSSSSSSKCNKACQPALPFTALLSAAVREGHMLYTFTTRSSLNQTGRGQMGGGGNHRLQPARPSFRLRIFNYIYVKDFNQGMSEINRIDANSPDHKDFHNCCNQ